MSADRSVSPAGGMFFMDGVPAGKYDTICLGDNHYEFCCDNVFSMVEIGEGGLYYRLNKDRFIECVDENAKPINGVLDITNKGLVLGYNIQGKPTGYYRYEKSGFFVQIDNKKNDLRDEDGSLKILDRYKQPLEGVLDITDKGLVLGYNLQGKPTGFYRYDKSGLFVQIDSNGNNLRNEGHSLKILDRNKRPLEGVLDITNKGLVLGYNQHEKPTGFYRYDKSGLFVQIDKKRNDLRNDEDHSLKILDRNKRPLEGVLDITNKGLVLGYNQHEKPTGFYRYDKSGLFVQIGDRGKRIKNDEDGSLKILDRYKQPLEGVLDITNKGLVLGYNLQGKPTGYYRYDKYGFFVQIDKKRNDLRNSEDDSLKILDRYKQPLERVLDITNKGLVLGCNHQGEPTGYYRYDKSGFFVQIGSNGNNLRNEDHSLKILDRYKRPLEGISDITDKGLVLGCNLQGELTGYYRYDESRLFVKRNNKGNDAVDSKGYLESVLDMNKKEIPKVVDIDPEGNIVTDPDNYVVNRSVETQNGPESLRIRSQSFEDAWDKDSSTEMKHSDGLRKISIFEEMASSESSTDYRVRFF